MEISIKLFTNTFTWQFFFNFPPTSNHLHPLQVKNCDSNSRLVVDKDDNGKFRLKRVKVPDSVVKTMETKGFFQFKIIIQMS